MKDVPVLLPIELGLAVILERDTPLDALVSKNGLPLAELPPGARVGTGSLRRSSQLLQIRPDLEIVPLRGNINTRLRKMETENLEAVILAGAGLRRMGWDHRITELISPDLLLPAMGQGAIGLETRKNHPELQHLLFELDHEETHLALDAERAFVRTLEGGCQVPIGAYATLDDQGGLILRGLVASLDGKTVYRKEKHGPAIDGPRVGRELAEDILSMGAGRILQEIYNPPDS
ncbi:MAG: hydroxymethylbilane synthase, partial [Nitrospinaceae bacterium]|nr:hydroxymethylbilane synthase [Nitrospinaceae bacterium]NIR56136.1 hydroxymethylbilane synthase [Nitrospinaceae bacterium]NIS86591.1 hydroxymethylbilane synthase [Nitrospinaceae bacterium]NIT83421.1 hydroxymethylbilane synthase [Nitrospinaceae bacterium]NIU45630.1 hydroxymethylbilane synthase [Nitrospinaceae bacterium]